VIVKIDLGLMEVDVSDMKLTSEIFQDVDLLGHRIGVLRLDGTTVDVKVFDRCA
jgi:hypothetical protein